MEIVIAEPLETRILEVRMRLRAFNMRHFETSEARSYLIKETTDQGQFLGGICFETFGDWLEIEYLFVEEDRRGRGLGRKLVARAEEFGRKDDCTTACLETFDFQARPFYEALGYEVVFERRSYPHSGSKFFMQKELVNA